MEVSALNPHVSVDCVIFGYDFEDANDHQQNKKITDLVLPGNLVRDNETLDESAKRILKELTSLENIFMEQFYTFGDPNRVRKKQDAEWLRSMRTDPDARVITVAYFALVKLNDYVPKPDSFARRSEWIGIDKIPKLAFDHNEIVEKALETLRFELLPKKFTLSQVQKLYEAIHGTPLDKRNFRKKLKALNIVTPLGEKQKGVSHKPAGVYTLNQKAYQESRLGVF